MSIVVATNKNNFNHHNEIDRLSEDSTDSTENQYLQWKHCTYNQCICHCIYHQKRKLVKEKHFIAKTRTSARTHTSKYALIIIHTTKEWIANINVISKFSAPFCQTIGCTKA